MFSSGGRPVLTVVLGFLVATAGGPGVAGATIDSFKCYKAQTATGAPDFVEQGVSLADQFETKDTSVRSPATLCNPVTVDGSATVDATAHLECYKIKDAPGQEKFVSREVESANAFGTERLRLKKAGMLCSPAEVDGQASALNLDSFKCYGASTAKGTTKFVAQEVLLDDDFDSSKSTTVMKPSRLCVPVDQESGGILDAASSLECYKIKDVAGQPKFAPLDAATQTPFGTETLTASKSNLLCVPSTVSEGLCDNSAVTTYDYLMAFHQCTADCQNPQNHTVYLAGSDNGTDWTLIEEFASFAGSVPDVVFYNDFLYVFTPNEMVKLNACFEQVDSGTVTLNSTEDTDGFVDASLIVSGNDLVMFYLPGISGMDPAGCSIYPCTKEIHSAVADDTTLASFTQASGDRVSLEITAGALSDPDVIEKSDGSFLLYVSAGQDTYAYTGSTLTDTFASPDGLTPRKISDAQGGVPGAIQAPDGSIWLYVSRNQGGVDVIRRAVSTDGITTLAGPDFSTVLDYSISPAFAVNSTVGSPSVIAWPGASWSREQ